MDKVVKVKNEDLDTYVNTSRLPSSVALEKLLEHHGDIYDTLDASHEEADKIKSPEKFSAVPQNDVVGVDDQLPLESFAIHENHFVLAEKAAPQNDVVGVDDQQPLESFVIHENHFFVAEKAAPQNAVVPLKSFAIHENHFAFVDPLIPSHTKSVSHPREVPTEAARTGVSGRSGTRASAAINGPDDTIATEYEMIRAAIKSSNEDMDELQLALALSLSVQTAAEKVTLSLNESAEVSEQDKVKELPILKWKVNC